ncbi:MAG: hypothetical protein ACO1OB_29980 [Archangium sp.]
MRWLMVMVCAVAVSGCAASRWAAASSLAAEQFPKKEELQKVALRAPKLDLARNSAKSIDSWTLKGPLPTVAGVEHMKAVTPWEVAVAQDAPNYGAALSADMQCVAREVAHYYAARDEYPGNSLRAFIERRCGSTATHTSLWALHGEVPEKLPDDKWLENWRADVKTKLAAVKAPLTGMYVLREGKKGVVVFAWSTPNAEFAGPVPLVGTNGKVVLKGRITGRNSERISALINKGEYGIEECKTLEVLRPPDFAFECPVDARDVHTTVAIGAFEPGRILGQSVADFTLWPAGKPGDTWQRSADSADVPKGDFNAQFLGAVNRMRQRAGLPLVSESKTQTATAMQLAPHYFAAQFGEGDPLEADRIAMGMMAGWDVNADVVSSGFGNAMVLGSRDLSVFMDFALDDPFQRKALTEPRAKLMAIGSVDDSDHALAAIFATYVPMGAFERQAAEEAIITRLNTLRQDRKLGLAQWTLWPDDVGGMVEAKLKARAWTPVDAQQFVIEKTAEVAKGQVVGYVQLVDDLDNFQFPPEVLMRSNINVFLAVGTYRAEDWAQSRYVVCFVVAKNGDIETASR